MKFVVYREFYVYNSKKRELVTLYEKNTNSCAFNTFFSK